MQLRKKDDRTYTIILEGQEVCTAAWPHDDQVNLLVDGTPICAIYRREAGHLFDATLSPYQEKIRPHAPKLAEKFQRHHSNAKAAIEYVAGHILEAREEANPGPDSRKLDSQPRETNAEAVSERNVSSDLSGTDLSGKRSSGPPNYPRYGGMSARRVAAEGRQ